MKPFEKLNMNLTQKKTDSLAELEGWICCTKETRNKPLCRKESVHSSISALSGERKKCLLTSSFSLVGLLSEFLLVAGWRQGKNIKQRILRGLRLERRSPSKKQWLCGCSRAERSYSTFKVRRGGSEEIPLIQGKEQRLRFAGAGVKRYPTSKVRGTQVRRQVLPEGIRETILTEN